MTQTKSTPEKREMGRARSPEPLDFFIWTVEDVGLWLEDINLGSYRQVFEENGVNGEYLESLSMFTTEQILRFIRRCHMKWGDFITLCKELRRIKVACLKGGARSPQAMVGSVMPLGAVCEGGQAEQAVPGGVLEAGTITTSTFESSTFASLLQLRRRHLSAHRAVPSPKWSESCFFGCGSSMLDYVHLVLDLLLFMYGFGIVT